MAIYYIHKSIAGFSAVLGIILLVVCFWTFCSIRYRVEADDNKNTTRAHGEAYADNLEANSNEDNDENAYGLKEPDFDFDIRMGSSILMVPSSTAKSKMILMVPSTSAKPKMILTVPSTSAKPEMIFRFPEDDKTPKNEMSSLAHLDLLHFPKTFEKIILGCVWVSIIGALVQFGSCFILICSPALKIPQRAKFFVAVHSAVFIILIATFFVAVTYDRNEDQYHSMTGFNVQVKKSINGFSSNFITFLLYDLNCYYTFLAVDMTCIFFIMISICCLMRYDDKMEGYFDAS